MIFNNLPTSYRLVTLNETELADAIEDWLKKEHPNVTRIGTLEGKIAFIANVPIKVSTDTVQLNVSLETPPKATREYRVGVKRLNSGIGVDLKKIFADGAIHDLGEIYQTLKPKYPHLTRNKLQHNFYAIKGIRNLGKYKWQASKT